MLIVCRGNKTCTFLFECSNVSAQKCCLTLTRATCRRAQEKDAGRLRVLWAVHAGGRLVPLCLLSARQQVEAATAT